MLSDSSSGDFDNCVAWQKFTPLGIIALLPLDPDHSSLVWSVKSELGERLMNMDDDSFVDQLNRALWDDNDVKIKGIDKVEKLVDTILDVLPPFGRNRDRTLNTHKQYPPRIISIVPGSRKRFPLKFMLATQFIGRRVALIGDAWHRVHPLAGQGLNLGLGDVECLERCLTEGFNVSADIGNELVLKKYQTERLRYVLPMMTAINSLDYLYQQSSEPSCTDNLDYTKPDIEKEKSQSRFLNSSFSNLPLSLLNICQNFKMARSIGLQVIDSSRWIKRAMVDYVSA